MNSVQMNSADIQTKYVDPSNPGNFGSLTSFLANNAKYKNTKAVKEALNKLEVYSVHRSPKRKKQQRKVMYGFKNSIVAADLASMLNMSPRLNKSTKYLLVIRELLSKYLMVYPLKNKKSATVAAAIDSF